MKFVINRNIYTREIINVYQTMADAAKDVGVENSSIRQAILKRCRCKDYDWEFIEIDNKKILNLINECNR